MREFNTKEAEGDYIITFETDDRKAFEQVQTLCRMLVDGKDGDAIPVEWIEKWGRRNTWYFGNKDNVITMLLSEWKCKQRVKQANEMLEKWDKENETTGKN